MKAVTLLKYLLLTIATMLSASNGFAGGLGIRGAPQWVNDGTSCMMIQGHRWFQGVGSAPPVGDNALQLSISQGRATRALERFLLEYLNALAIDYLEATNAAADKPVVLRQLKRLAKELITKAQANARWQQSSTGILYSLVQLDMKTVKEVAASSQDIDSKLREFIRKKGNMGFDRCESAPDNAFEAD